MARTMPQHWLMFVAHRAGQPIAARWSPSTRRGAAPGAATGAATEHVPCLHFEACYYQPLQWCIAHGYRRFEGGAQGEHKMARGLLPVGTTSAHWLRRRALRQAVADFLAREAPGHRGLRRRTARAQPVQERRRPPRTPAADQA
jgi:predicted N-acyltransferase